MKEILTYIANYGLSLVLAALFILDWITNKKVNSETLKQIAESNKNIAKSLDIIQNNQLILENKVDRNYDFMKERR